MPRNHKICQEVLDVFRQLIAEENMLLACTDEDLVLMLNERLFVEHRISYRTFQRYKRRALAGRHIPDADPLYLDLLEILRMAYVKLKQQLLGAIIRDGHGSKRFMWILERKFREWNPRREERERETVREKEKGEREREKGFDDDDDMEGPIVDEAQTLPTMIGKYHDLDAEERPKDIMPVHHAVFNLYVIPNPNYDGEEDDNTRAIQRMWELRRQMDREAEEELATRDERLAQRRREIEERRRLAEEAASAPGAPTEAELDERERREEEKARHRARLLAKIAASKKGNFYEEETDGDGFVPYDLD